jgi:hypothetical protein
VILLAAFFAAWAVAFFWLGRWTGRHRSPNAAAIGFDRFETVQVWGMYVLAVVAVVFAITSLFG